MTELNKLTMQNIKTGLLVTDKDGDFGIIRNCDDIHNIKVEFTLGGVGLYCLDEECEEYEELYIFNLT